MKQVDLKTGLPNRDPEFGTRMDHKGKEICPSAMGYHNQGHDSYDPTKQLFYMGINHICMDWEPFMLPYRAGQFFVGATLWMYPGPKGDRQNYLGLGQIKAYNAITGEYKWEKMERFSVWGGTMATAGNLVFYGTLDGFLKARNSDTGELLWKFKLPSGVIGHPMTYETGRHAVRRHHVRRRWLAGRWPRVRPAGSDRRSWCRRRLQEPRRTTPRWVAVCMVFSLDGKGPYDNLETGEFKG